MLRLNVGGSDFTTSAHTLLWDCDASGVNWFSRVVAAANESSGSTIGHHHIGGGLSDDGGDGEEMQHSAETFTVDKTTDGAYFIDRDPHLFAYVLQFLRSHAVPPSVSSDGRLASQLLLEAQYFMIPSFERELSAVVEHHYPPTTTSLCNRIPLLRSREEGYYRNDADTASITFDTTATRVLLAYGAGSSSMMSVLRWCDTMPEVWNKDAECQKEFGSLFLNRAVRGTYALEGGVAMKFSVSMHRSTMAVVAQDSLLVVISHALRSLNIQEDANGGNPSRWLFYKWQ